MEPPVSDPRVAGTKSAATAAALPPEEPPGTRVISRGLAVLQKALFSQLEPMANSSIFNLPKGMNPFARKLATAVAS